MDVVQVKGNSCVAVTYELGDFDGHKCMFPEGDHDESKVQSKGCKDAVSSVRITKITKDKPTPTEYPAQCTVQAWSGDMEGRSCYNVEAMEYEVVCHGLYSVKVSGPPGRKCEATIRAFQSSSRCQVPVGYYNRDAYIDLKCPSRESHVLVTVKDVGVLEEAAKVDGGGNVATVIVIAIIAILLSVVGLYLLRKKCTSKEHMRLPANDDEVRLFCHLLCSHGVPKRAPHVFHVPG